MGWCGKKLMKTDTRLQCGSGAYFSSREVIVAGSRIACRLRVLLLQVVDSMWCHENNGFLHIFYVFVLFKTVFEF